MTGTDFSGNYTIYGDHLGLMQAALDSLLAHIEEIREDMRSSEEIDPVDHVLFRIKSDESMRKKCRERGLPEDAGSALAIIHDAIGIRIVCPFRNDVYEIRSRLSELAGYEFVREKDYIRHAKSNGYRSLHLILKTPEGYFAEIQLRTISMDTWGALDHLLRYKRESLINNPLIENEMKRCADELASTDISMQTLRDMIMGTPDN